MTFTGIINCLGIMQAEENVTWNLTGFSFTKQLKIKLFLNEWVAILTCSENRNLPLNVSGLEGSRAFSG